MKKIFKKFKIIGIATLMPLMLAGCGNNKATIASKESNRQASSSVSSSQSALQIAFKHGKYEQASGLLSVPVVMKNTGSNSTLIDSNNFTLHVGKVKLHPYQLGAEPADYHIDFGTGNIWQNTLTFNTGVHLTDSQLKEVKLTYMTDSGKVITAEKLGLTASQSENRVSLSSVNTTDLGSYYKQTEDYIKQVKKEKEENPDTQVESLKDEFQDDKYDQLRAWVAVPSTGPKGSSNVVLKVLNNTNSDFTLSYGDFELVDGSGNEIRVDATYRQYTLYIPHGKYTTVAIPMENSISSQNRPYHVELRQNQGGNFFTTKDGFNPIEIAFSNQVDANVLFSLSPAKYPQKSIQWSNQNVKDNAITADVKLTDYFNLDNKSSGYKVVGNNDDGRQLVEPVTSATPRWVPTTDRTTVKWKVKDLSKVMNYTHVVLQYDGKTILTLK
ncbi:hypothetical protein [Limosilactobacillus allomucosae]|uniref:hypothetical protein n=1 Tax=Limosilactobacillus allomucosae TaxID=3142938 RepID=UPI00326501CD